VTKVRINLGTLLRVFRREVFKGIKKSELSIDGDIVMTVNEFGKFCEKIGKGLAGTIERIAEVEESEYN